MAALLLDIRKEDEVIVPSFTFVSTANAFALRGARIIFCDVRRDTLNIDEKKIEELITPRTKAIILVHYAGVGCEVDAIMSIATKYNLSVVEDNAHGLFGKYRGRWLGTFGDLATQSFHETKNISCGEGGALLINNSDYADRAEIIREKGTNRSRFFRGEVDKYSWVDLGSSYVMSDILAAFLYGQLEAWDNIQKKRRALWERYNEELEDWAMKMDARRPFAPDHCEQSWHMYYIILPSLRKRTAFINHLRKHDIQAVFHYHPLHLSEYASRWNGKKGDCPVTEDMCDRLVRLPLYTSMIDGDQGRVIHIVESFK